MATEYRCQQMFCITYIIGNNNPGHGLQTVSLRNAIETTDMDINVDHKLRFLSHYASIVKKLINVHH